MKTADGNCFKNFNDFKNYKNFNDFKSFNAADDSKTNQKKKEPPLEANPLCLYYHFFQLLTSFKSK